MGRENRQTMTQEEGRHPTTTPALNQTHDVQWQMVRVIITNDIVDKAINRTVSYQQVYPENIVLKFFFENILLAMDLIGFEKLFKILGKCT